MPDMNYLASYMQQLAVKIPDFGNQVAKDVASAILSDLTQVTPIDVGEAVSNWQVTVGSAAISRLPAFVPSPKGRVKDKVWIHRVDPAITAQANIPFIMQAGQAVLSKKKPGETVFIANNAPHIVDLDQGSSTQAPQGFVDRAIVLGIQIVGNARLKP